jgi:hypothetical protein
MEPQRKSRLDRGTVLGLIAVCISIVGVLRPAGAGGTASRIVKVTTDKPATCPPGAICPWLPPATVENSDLVQNTLTQAKIRSVGTQEMIVPSIQRKSTSDQEVANGDATVPTEAIEFETVVTRTGGSAAPADCPTSGNLVEASCVIVTRDGVYDVKAQVIWEGNAVGRRAIWGLRFHPSFGLDGGTVFVEEDPGAVAHPAYGGQVMNLSYSIDMEAGEGILIGASQNSGNGLDVLDTSVLTVTWSAPPSPTP